MRHPLVLIAAFSLSFLLGIAAFAGQPPALEPANKSAAPSVSPPAAEPPSLPDPESPARTKKIDSPLAPAEPARSKKIDGPIEPSSPGTNAAREMPPQVVRPTSRPVANKGPAPAIIKVTVPANATIWIEDQRMTQTGAQRSFASPPIEPGKTFAYNMKLSWPVGNGQPDFVTQQEVTVHAGETTAVDFMSLTGVASSQPAAQNNRGVVPAHFNESRK